MNIETATIDELKLTLAEVTTTCPGDGVAPPSSGFTVVTHTWTHCTKCDDTGRVPLLDPKLVREECSNEHWGAPKNDPNCQTCTGRGWVPTHDAWKWIEAVLKTEWMIFEAQFSDDNYCVTLNNSGPAYRLIDRKYVRAPSFEQAFFQAVAKALW